MYDGNPREIDVGSSQREVRVSEGSNYRESTVFLVIANTRTKSVQKQIKSIYVDKVGSKKR